MAEENFGNRLTDTPEKPVFLAPIDGWQDAPILTVEKTVEGLGIPYVANSAIHAKEFAENYIDENEETNNLTEDEIASIVLYTQETLYRKLNLTLYERDRNKVKPYFPYIKLLNTALEKLPRYENRVWRGIQPKTDISKNYKKGKKFRWWGYTSATKEGNVVERFLGKGDGMKVLFRIDSKTGVEIEKMSVFDEAEVLFASGTQFEVKDVINITQNHMIIELNEISSILTPTEILPPPPKNNLEEDVQLKLQKEEEELRKKEEALQKKEEELKLKLQKEEQLRKKKEEDLRKKEEEIQKIEEALQLKLQLHKEKEQNPEEKQEIIVSNINDFDCFNTLQGHTNAVEYVFALSINGKTKIISGSDDNTIKIWG